MYTSIPSQKPYLDFRRLVILSIFVLQGRSVAISQKPLEPVFALQFPNNLVNGLAVQGLVIHSKCGVANTGQQGGICILGEEVNLNVHCGREENFSKNHTEQSWIVRERRHLSQP